MAGSGKERLRRVLRIPDRFVFLVNPLAGSRSPTTAEVKLHDRVRCHVNGAYLRVGARVSVPLGF